MPEDTPKCPVCGTPLPGRLGGGLCAACLVSLALEDDDEASGETGGSGPAHSYQVISVLDRQPERTRYLAKRRDFHALVALEIIAPAIAARIGNRAIEARVNLLRSLRHPGIPRCLDGWIEPTGECCLVSEYTAGRSLAHGGELSDDQVLRVFDDLCEAVATAHDRCVVHGHLSLASIVLIPAGLGVTPQVTAFTVDDQPFTVADDVAGLGRILEALGTGRPFAAAAARLAARATGLGDGPPFGTVRALQAAAAAIQRSGA